MFPTRFISINLAMLLHWDRVSSWLASLGVARGCYTDGVLRVFWRAAIFCWSLSCISKVRLASGVAADWASKALVFPELRGWIVLNAVIVWPSWGDSFIVFLRVRLEAVVMLPWLKMELGFELAFLRSSPVGVSCASEWFLTEKTVFCLGVSNGYCIVANWIADLPAGGFDIVSKMWGFLFCSRLTNRLSWSSVSFKVLLRVSSWTTMFKSFCNRYLRSNIRLVLTQRFVLS